MDLPPLQDMKNRILSVEKITQVHEYALQLLEVVGCTVQCEEALDILGNAGCDVRLPMRVKIPRKLVIESIELAPKQFQVYDRDGNPAMTIESDRCYYGTGSDCPNTIDLYSGKRRQSTKDDIGRLAQFCDVLPNIDFVMSFGIAQNVHSGADFIHGYEAMLLNTKKPAIVTGHGRNDMLTMIEMAAASRGSLEEIKLKPSLILYTEPMSPLIHSDMGVSKGLVCCENGIPFIYIGSPMMGATGPATVEGTLVQTVAECLSGLVIFQNKQPGAKFIFGGDSTVMDMSNMIFSYGAPELITLNGGLSDMAHFYGLPFFCIGGATDSKILDAQAGLEYALSLYDATLNGCNIIHDCGYLESGLTSSFESVLFADEIIGMLKHILKPLEFNSDTVPLDIMNKVGPAGSFLKEKHTRDNYKNYWNPRFLDRRNYERWSEDGGKDLRDVLNFKAKQIFEKCQPQPLHEKNLQLVHNAIDKHKSDVR
ncbi:MAG: trimethylamine methyltransferase family protein [Syntrophobacteria bacterium]